MFRVGTGWGENMREWGTIVYGA